jgi:hypothetical protein
VKFKIEGDTYVPKDAITFYVEHPIQTNESIYQLPIAGKGQIADYGFNNPRFIKGRLTSILNDFSGLIFQFGETSNSFGIMYFKRDSRYIDSESITSSEELMVHHKMRDYAQSLSLQLDNFNYMIGGKNSAPLDMIEEFTDLIIIKEEEKPLECVICLNEMISNEKCRKIQICKHLFHQDCIERWLLRCNNCPLCRKSIEK